MMFQGVVFIQFYWNNLKCDQLKVKNIRNNF